jgi:hypothetical protein
VIPLAKPNSSNASGQSSALALEQDAIAFFHLRKWITSAAFRNLNIPVYLHN